MIYNFEAYDEMNDIKIYNGTSKSSLIQELFDYIKNSNHIDESIISDEDILDLNEEVLNQIGIKLYVNRW